MNSFLLRRQAFRLPVSSWVSAGLAPGLREVPGPPAPPCCCGLQSWDGPGAWKCRTTRPDGKPVPPSTTFFSQGQAQRYTSSYDSLGPTKRLFPPLLPELWGASPGERPAQGAARSLQTASLACRVSSSYLPSPLLSSRRSIRRVNVGLSIWVPLTAFSRSCPGKGGQATRDHAQPSESTWKSRTKVAPRLPFPLLQQKELEGGKVTSSRVC